MAYIQSRESRNWPNGFFGSERNAIKRSVYLLMTAEV